MLRCGLALLAACENGGGRFLLDRSTFSLPAWCYTVQTARGSGPGGQGMDHSSNKVILRVDLNKLSSLLAEVAPRGENDCDGADFARKIVDQLKTEAASTKRDELVVTCHENRSLHTNTQIAVDKACAMICRASFAKEERKVSPFAHRPPDHVRDRAVFKKRLKGNMLRAKREARKGIW